MSPIFQTNFEKGRGNCFQAAVASILEIPLDSVLDVSIFGPGKAWWNPFQAWVEEKGYALVYFEPGAAIVPMNCYGIGCCNVIDQEERHAVVCRYWSEEDGDRLLSRCEIVHDPNDRVPHKVVAPDCHILLFPQPKGAERIAA